MPDLTQLQRDIEWYREGERDSDFVKHLADELLARIAEMEAERDALRDRRCSDCKLPTWYENSIFGHCIHVSHIDPDFACNRWTERGTP